MLISPHPLLGFPKHPIPGNKYILHSWKLNDVIQKIPVNAMRGDETHIGMRGDTPIGNASSNIVFIPYTGDPTEGVVYFFWKKDPLDGCNLYVCDRCIVGGVPWNRLNALGFILGNGAAADMRLGNMHFQCRSLKGGKSMTGTGEQSNTYGLSTAPANYDEWDDIFGALVPILGVPHPTADEAKRAYPYAPTEADFLSELNQFLHWCYMYTWCQESLKNGQYACIRGYHGPRFWYGYAAPSDTNAHIGFRPLLKDLESGNLKSGSRGMRFFFMPFDPVPGQSYDLLSAKLNGTMITKTAVPQGNRGSAIEFVGKTDNPDEAVSGIYQGLNAEGNYEFLAARPLVCGVPYNRLNELGLINGVAVDVPLLGQTKIRAPKGGSAKDGANDTTAGVSTAKKVSTRAPV